MIPVALEEITSASLAQLLDEARIEDRTIEYKLSIPGTADSEKIPWLLKPVCSFANTDGGDLIFGLRAPDGIPQEIAGVQIRDLDQCKLTLEHLIQNGIEPQIRGIGIKGVPLPNGKHALVVRVTRSWTSPHRVKGNARFYARNTAGAFELDVPQLKQAFLLSETVAQRIREFRADRIAVVSGSRAPVRLKDGLRVLLHLLPLSSFTTSLALPAAKYAELWQRLKPSGTGSIDYHLNFDGIVVMSGTEEKGYRAYSQFFRSGVIEFVRVYGERGNYLPSIEYEEALLSNFKNGITVLRYLRFEPPIFITLTLAAATGYQLGIRDAWLSSHEPLPFDREALVIPEMEISSLNTDPALTLRPLFDYVWNAAGYRGTPNYDEEGNWRPHS